MFQKIVIRNNSKNIYLMVVIIFSVFFIFSDLGKGKMSPVDDCYLAQKAKQIVQSGDWLTLRFADRVTVDSAPCYIWLMAIMFKFFGVSEYSARFFSAFFGVATIISIYFLGRMLFDEWIGLFSSFVMLTTPLFFTYSRRAMFDVTLTFWVTLAFIFFMKGMKKRNYFILFGISTGIAVLTKSALGFSPILIAIVYLLLLKEYRKIIDPFFLLGIMSALLVSFPWYFYQYSNDPEKFVNSHLKLLIYKRMFMFESERSSLWYLKILWIYYWPWIPLAAYSFVRLLINCFKKVNPNTLIVLCWTVVVIGVMSIMNVKKMYYIMPVFPALALLSSVVLNSILAKEKRKKVFVGGCFILSLLLAIVIAVTPITLPYDVVNNKYPIIEETWSFAKYARENFPKDEKIVLYRIWLWLMKSTYLFYSDRNISASVSDKDSLIDILKKGRVKYCLTKKEFFPELTEINSLKLKVVKETSSFVLLRAAYVEGDNF